MHGLAMIERKNWAGVAALGLIITAAACGQDGSAAPPAEEERTGRIVNVQVLEVQPRPFTDYVNLTGAAAADRDVTVAAEESGVVREIFVDKGAAVQAGQPLARIDDRLLRAQAEQAAAQAELARETWERQKRLWEQDSIGSEMAYIQARQGFLTAQANARALAERLERTVIRAPIAGLVEDRMIEVGTMVAPGTPAARIVDVNPVKVVSGLPERYATDITKGASAEVYLTALGQEYAGKVSFVGAAVNPQSRTVPVEIAVPNPGGRLRPGMVAEVRIQRTQLDDVLVVPQDAIQRSEDGYYVYVVVEEDGQAVARTRPVVLGESQDGLVPVEGGLEAGDRVVIVGQKQVAAGDRVRVLDGGEVR